MKSIIVFLFSIMFSCFAFAGYNTEEVDFTETDRENLPPVSEMVGVIDEDSVEQAIRGQYEQNDRGEEIQLAHGEECQRRHGYRDCEDSPVVVVNSPPVVVVNPSPVVVPVPVPVPVAPVIVGQVCRNGGFYCYTNYPGPVGASCTCYSFGFPWLYGQVSTW